MKKMFAILLALALVMTGTALAAEWTEGRSPSKPYLGKPEADFTKTIGYMMRYPNGNMQPENYCDTLQIFLPREDLTVGIGTVKVYDAEGDGSEPLMTVDFQDGVSVTVRPMNAVELDSMLWGGGVSYDIRLPISLEMGRKYYVTMDAGCVSTSDYSMTNTAITEPDKWTVCMGGEYGVNNLFYAVGPEPVEETEEEAEQPAEAAEEEAAEPMLRIVPEVGDTVTFDLVLGGEAVSAVPYSQNDAVVFDEQVFTESGTYTGKVADAELYWGIAFLREDGSYISRVDLGR